MERRVSNIWQVLDDSIRYVKSKRVSLDKVDALEKQLYVLLMLEQKRVEFYDSILKKKCKQYGLRNTKKLRKLWRTSQQRYMQEELSILKTITRNILY